MYKEQCIVIGLQSTGAEVRIEEAVAKHGTELVDFISLSAQLLQLVFHSKEELEKLSNIKKKVKLILSPSLQNLMMNFRSARVANLKWKGKIAPMFMLQEAHASCMFSATCQRPSFCILVLLSMQRKNRRIEGRKIRGGGTHRSNQASAPEYRLLSNLGVNEDLLPLLQRD
ncbi:hypothetical protein POM88_016421 [Heracleum sosnowskyi]|uniref:Uncharacterized protein n=1 Tax=Heracleum sosnowskyi TaxID=360622 RepID=A0AAD8INX8_9APIA|nr:hypothetical protein POM88_016421 [Heracleum sosnowskyi]